MGREVARFTDAIDSDDRIVCGVDPTKKDFSFPTVASLSRAELSDEFSAAAECADVIIDFSNRAATRDVVSYAARKKIPTVIGATGQTEGDLRLIRQAAREVPIFLSANMSTGVAFVAETVRRAAEAFPEADVEIIETHHAKKEDAPSGTALMLADAIASVRDGARLNLGRRGNEKREKNEICIHSLRMGGAVGRHEVIFGSYNQTVTVLHEAHSRAMYADGALRAARFLLTQSVGLYGMDDMLRSAR